MAKSKSVLGIPAKYNQTVLYGSMLAAIAIGTYLLLRVLAYSPVDVALAAKHLPTYDLGEPVVFGITNQSQKAVTLEKEAPWEVMDSSGQVVYAPTSSEVASILAAQEKRFWTWDHSESGGQTAGPGSYTITVDYLVGGKAATASIKVTLK